MSTARSACVAGSEASEMESASSLDRSAGLVADSLTVAMWTLLSRVTGFGRLATMAAIFGPTYFGNLFQASALLPNMIFSALGGSVVAATLVPQIVKCIDRRDKTSARRVANGFLGITTAVLSIVLVLGVVGAPLLLKLVTAAVVDPRVRQQQLQLGWPLLSMLLPQILLYSVAATGAAVQNAHGRFAFAAAAPVLENIGIIAVLIASAMLFGPGLDMATVSSCQLVLLGIGSTAAVGMHAAVQWWGARRLGVSLVPRAGWREPDIRRIMLMAFKSSGYSAFYNLTTFGAIVVAGQIPGGVLAFQIGQMLSFLPVALSAVPLAAAQLPRLSRCFNENNENAFHSIFCQSLALARFVGLPACILFIMMPETWARAVAFGQMANAAGVSMIAACIASIGAGVIAEATVVLSTSASYARHNASLPLMAIALRAAVAFMGMALAFFAMDGIAILWTVGLSVSAGSIVSAIYFHRALIQPLPAASQLISELAVSVGSIMPGMFAAVLLNSTIGSHYYDIGIALASLAISATFYLALQWLRGSSELRSILSGFDPRSA
jgi:putative peptidoglycan lipid II flippase